MPNICILGSQSERAWNFEVISASMVSSDESKVNATIQVNRISFSESVVSANVYWNCGADEDSTGSFVLLHSRSGRENDYSNTPYQIPNQNLKTFVDTYYHDLFYANVANCSNLPPYFDVPPVKMNYILNECSLTGDGFPYILPLGYYKFHLEIKGEGTLTISFIFKVTSKSMG
ncbi:uncharacterized protein LOC132787365 [Drosophila nasuta]|uniref:uncharacterized protein LOC132787365 n=1 Tax=Drosophila nasuta TaxID=42062 RepID=UPI00295E2A24|nr:uncharacterized protein LOC132787365 [Drosophila nasuta]